MRFFSCGGGEAITDQGCNYPRTIFKGSILGGVGASQIRHTPIWHDLISLSTLLFWQGVFFLATVINATFIATV